MIQNTNVHVNLIGLAIFAKKKNVIWYVQMAVNGLIYLGKCEFNSAGDKICNCGNEYKGNTCQYETCAKKKCPINSLNSYKH